MYDMYPHQGGEEHEVVVVHPEHVPLLQLAHLLMWVHMGGGEAHAHTTLCWFMCDG